MKTIILGTVIFFVMCSGFPALAVDGFTQKDRELLIELKVRMGEIDKRFDQVDTRFSELRGDMNKRFEEILHFFTILAGIFGSMVIAIFGFAYWDRRSILYKAREEVRQVTEQDRKIVEENKVLLGKLHEAMRRLADKSPDVREVLQKLNLL